MLFRKGEIQGELSFLDFYIVGFSLLSMLEFLNRETETCEIINHPLCGCATDVIQKNHLSVKIELFKLLINERKGDFNGK
jgi:hypothetical protein